MGRRGGEKDFLGGIGPWVSVNNFGGIHLRVLGTKLPFLLILGVVEGREFLFTPLFQVPPPLHQVGPSFLHCLGMFLEGWRERGGRGGERRDQGV